MPDDPTSAPAPDATTEATVVPEPTVKPRLVDIARAKSASHDRTTCLCPFCRSYRKQNGIPNPPHSNPNIKKKVVDPAIEGHDRTRCPCTNCREFRSKRASDAAHARHAKTVLDTPDWRNYDWEHAPLDQSEKRLSDMRREIEVGARALQQRYSTRDQATVKCEVCKSDIVNGRWAQSKAVRDQVTGLLRTVFLCSQACINNHTYNPAQHGPNTGEPTGLKAKS